MLIESVVQVSRDPDVEAAAQVTSARAVILDQAGHMAHIDDPDGWLTAVASFLAED